MPLQHRTGPCRQALVLLSLALAACTGSQKQLFSPDPTVRPVPADLDGGIPDSSVLVPADTGPGPDDGEDSGVLMVGLHLDPDATFDWTETLPGKVGACEPGQYTGSFECTTESATGSGRLIGSIQITLAQSLLDTERLILSKGLMTGFAGGTNELFSSTLEGKLLCDTATLSAESGKSDVYPFPGFGDDLTSSMLTATLEGAFDAEALSIQGEVVVTSDAGFRCAGPFMLRASR